MGVSPNTYDTALRHKIHFNVQPLREAIKHTFWHIDIKKVKNDLSASTSETGWASVMIIISICNSAPAGWIHSFAETLIDKKRWTHEREKAGKWRFNQKVVKRECEKKKSKYLQVYKSWDLKAMHKKPSITAGKGLVGVERSKGWVMLEGLSTPRGQIRRVGKWDEGKPSLFRLPDLNLCVSSLLLLTIYPEKRGWEQMAPA